MAEPPVLRRAMKAWAFWRLHGTLATFRAAWRLHVYSRRRIVILTAPLAGPPPDPGPDGITFRPATPEDLDALPALRAYVQDGQWLHVARNGQRIAGYRRVALRFPKGSVLDAAVPPHARRVFTQDVYIRPEYRRHGLGLRLSLAHDRYLASVTGAEEIVAAVDADNLASLRMHVREGARPRCFVETHRVLFYQRYTVSPTMPPDVQRVVGEAGWIR